MMKYMKVFDIQERPKGKPSDTLFQASHQLSCFDRGNGNDAYYSIEVDIVGEECTDPNNMLVSKWVVDTGRAVDGEEILIYHWW